MSSTVSPAPLARYVRDGAIGRLELDRPPLNVVNIAMLDALSEALDQAAGDRGLRVLTLAGAGKAFCAGADVADHAADRVESMLTRFHRVIGRILKFDVPVVALVHGAALGGGFELVLACDMVLARDDATFGVPEIKLGVFPPVASVLLPRLIGRQRANDLILTGRTLTAAEAYGCGIVNRVWPADRFGDETRAYLGGMGRLSGAALRHAKSAVLHTAELSAFGGIERAERLYLNDLMREPDAHEGIAAFLEKRAPVWRDA
jgi:cyclohexa-1,5-dienecarbonyl-CoA hydratase